MKNLSFFCARILLMHGLISSYGFVEKIKENMKIKEDRVKFLTKEIGALYEKRLEALSDCHCSVHECSYEDFSDDTCHAELGADKEVCGSNCRGRKLNYNKSDVLTPPGVVLGNLSPDMKASICAFEGLFERLLKPFYLDDHVVTWTYIGMKNGIFRNWPATARTHTPDGDPLLDGCRYYDPTLRPWYQPAATGPKDIIFVVDKSESTNEMRDGRGVSKWEEMTDTIAKMIETLAPTDYFNVVTFADVSAPLLDDDTLKPATSENKESSKRKLMELEPPKSGTGSNFSMAFEESFRLLIGSCSKRNCSECEKVIVFVTDGKDISNDGDNELKPSAFTSQIETYQRRLADVSSKRASVFAYSLGEDSDDSVLKQIACENDGFWALIRDEDDIITVVKDYYLFLASRFTTRIVWAEPYIDDFTGENITTVATPIFTSGENGESKEFIGVLGHDVFLFEFGDDQEATRNEIILQNHDRDNQRCAPPFNSTCDIQIQRNLLSNGATCVDRFPVESASSDKENPQCFTNGESYYKRFSLSLNWEEAKRHCEEDGGLLASVGSDKELEFLAGMASKDGSWIGAFRAGNSFVWVDGTSPELEVNSNYRGSLTSTDYGCLVIDSRGPTQNLDPRRCEEAQLSFICEYENDTRCEGKIRNPKDRDGGYFEIPPLRFCTNKGETMQMNDLIDAANALDSWEALCPFRSPLPDSETICCAECNKEENDDDSLLNVVIALAVVTGVLAIIVWTFVQGAIILYIQKRRKAKRKSISKKNSSSTPTAAQIFNTTSLFSMSNPSTSIQDF